MRLLFQVDIETNDGMDSQTMITALACGLTSVSRLVFQLRDKLENGGGFVTQGVAETAGVMDPTGQTLDVATRWKLVKEGAHQGAAVMN